MIQILLNAILQPAINRRATLMEKKISIGGWERSRISFVDAEVCWLLVITDRKETIVWRFVGR